MLSAKNVAKQAFLVDLFHKIICIVSHRSSVKNKFVMMCKLSQELIEPRSDEKAWFVFVFRTNFEGDIVIFISLKSVAVYIVYQGLIEI